MDIVLINPLYPRYESNMFASALVASLDMPPLGLLYIAANLEKHGSEITMILINLLFSLSQIKIASNSCISESPFHYIQLIKTKTFLQCQKRICHKSHIRFKSFQTAKNISLYIPCKSHNIQLFLLSHHVFRYSLGVRPYFC